MTIRIAMWSGPRNISTAMMRAWENRADSAVSDEPFYAAYLAITGIQHPMNEAVLASQPQDWAQVAEEISGPAPDGAELWFQKHMTHHMVPAIGRDWFPAHRHAFLIRDPAEVVASYAVKRETMTPLDLGYDLQADLFDEVIRRTDVTPPVIESSDVLKNPLAALSALCAALAVPFDDAMLAWPVGRRLSDGVWAPHWYASVEASTGFRPWAPSDTVLDDAQQAVVEACRPAYERLSRFRLEVPTHE
ncbi:MAG: sulfotransferase family protein [Rhodospirillaceae bacterium]|nr:sulfotransferase family protein [Rhodospirillaceae bacterium]